MNAAGHAAIRLFVNPAAGAVPARLWTEGDAAAARREIRSWPEYRPTPLHALPGLAARLGLGGLVHKDESHRFGLGAFKSLGGAYGVVRAVAAAVTRRSGDPVEAAALRSGDHPQAAALTVTCASEGNHGRAVAWGASLVGCRALIYLPASVAPARAAAIEELGADVERVAGDYDETVRHCAREAARRGHIVISDTAYPGYTTIPQYVMQGYTLLMEEVRAATEAAPPTHVFAQAGVGGLAGAVFAHILEAWGPDRPRMIVVEPHSADCFFRSARTGERTRADGIDTIMGGLACANTSTVAWRILAGADAFVTIPDAAAVEAMRTLAEPAGDDPPVVVGESGGAGLGAVLAVMRDPEARDALGLGPRSRVLTIGTEGAMDPSAYERLVGRPPSDVAAD